MSRSSYTALTDLGPAALTHRDAIEEVKAVLGIKHGYFDAWIYGFLENKNFNVGETVAKLHRRFAMEVNELATIEVSDPMQKSLRQGIIQDIGNDKQGRVVFYVCTKRDVPQSKFREQRRKAFDMFVSYGTRLREESKRCQLVMLINHEGAGLFRNTDMTFQSDVALRIAKFYPGSVVKMYIVNMNRMLAAMAKPIFKRLPPIVSDRIQVIDDTDVKNGVLLDLFDRSVLPVDLGGDNACDTEASWEGYASRVEDYFAAVKRAMLENGLTVKEAELRLIGIDPRNAKIDRAEASLSGDRQLSISVDQRYSSGMPSARYDDLKTLITCDSDDVYENRNYALGGGEGSWRFIMSFMPSHFALLFLEELLRWRSEVENQEVAERFRLVEESMVTGKNREVIRGLDVHDHRWYTGIPYPLRDLFRLVLTGVTLLNTVYFIGALVFFAVLSADVLLTTFFGFFFKPGNFFPLSCVLIMIMIQASSLCTRAIDIIVAIQRGVVIPPFQRLGSTVGAMAEVLLFFVVVFIQLIIFIVYAFRHSPLRGLQVSFATGWMSAMFIVAFTHAFFFTGIFTARERTKVESVGLATLPSLLALNFGYTRSAGSAQKNPLRISSLVICGIPLCLSLLLGTGFLLSRLVSMYVCTLVAALTAAFVVNYYSEAVTNSLSGSYVRLTLWMMTMTWLFATFVFGFQNLSANWAVVVVTATVSNGFFVVSAILCLNLRRNSWLLRVCFIVLLLYFVGCWIACFPVVGWHIGLFCLTLMTHNALNVIFAPRELNSIGSVFCVASAVLLLSLSVVMLGWNGTMLQYQEPQSRPSVSPLPSGSLTNLQSYHRYPVCSLSVGDGSNLFGIVDVSLLTEVVAARDTAFTVDFQRWFGGRDITYGGITTVLSAEGTPWEIHEFTAATANITFLVVTNRYAMSSIMAMVTWIDSMAMSPLGMFLPWDWTETFVYVLSFISRMIRYQWHTLIQALTTFLEDAQRNRSRTIILSGTGVAAGIASISAAQSGTQSIVFASPGLLHLLRKVSITEEAYHRYVLAVGAYYGVLDIVGGQDVTIKQKLVCSANARSCISQQQISELLLAACGDPYGRRHGD